MLPPPEGLWGMPPEMLATLPGYDPDIAKNRAEARKIMEKLGYGPDKRLAVTLSSRNIPAYRDPAVILIDQVKEIYIDAVLEPVETANWFPKIYRKDYTIAINGTESGVDDPDQQFYENFVCGAVRNYTGYCNPEVDKLIDQQSAEADREKRKQLVWEIERRLAEDGARPIIFYPRGGDLHAALCQGPDDDGQQHLQRLPHGRRLARQIDALRSKAGQAAGQGGSEMETADVRPLRIGGGVRCWLLMFGRRHRRLRKSRAASCR